MNTLNYKGYTAKIEFDPDDNILFGNIIGIRDTVGFHGESVTELKEAFLEAVDFYLYVLERGGKGECHSLALAWTKVSQPLITRTLG